VFFFHQSFNFKNDVFASNRFSDPVPRVSGIAEAKVFASLLQLREEIIERQRDKSRENTMIQRCTVNKIHREKG
jgi:hypothetical protein